MSSSDHWTQGKDIPLLSYYFPEIMAALKIVGTEQFFHRSTEDGRPPSTACPTAGSVESEQGAFSSSILVAGRVREGSVSRFDDIP
ncbi:hypothetical protein E2C01_068350 [Portunus trituberculatus]|uniref:Uncharacterized protein n=1 Tax=Portunus trituberculatus TaxID=210409 RepID=A0A5B7HW90_PORTR|nr:hypothetical protein [Portunus trituberculatus]